MNSVSWLRVIATLCALWGVVYRWVTGDAAYGAFMLATACFTWLLANRVEE